MAAMKSAASVPRRLTFHEYLATCLGLAWALLPTGSFAQTTTAGRGFTVRVDSRVELLSIVFRLAGSPEYNMCRLPAYEADIEQAFGRFKNHPTVELARRLRNDHGISFDAVVSFAVSITPPPELAERVPFGPDGAGLADARWHGAHASMFLAALKRFSHDADFPRFFANHRALYSSAEERFEALTRARISLAWYETFFGRPPGADYILVPGMCNGPTNYGPSVRPKSGREELYAIIGVTDSDPGGIPTFAPEIIPTIVHEFAHSFVNPFVERHRETLRPPADRLFPPVAEMMKAQAYGTGQTVVIESLVRATVVRYLRANEDQQRASRQLVDEFGRGFVWIEDLDRLFQQYESERGTYRTFDAFAPHVAAFFDGVSRSILDRLKQFEARRPKLVSMTPADGATDVDPSTARLVLVFDRPMGSGYSINYGSGGKGAYPDVDKVAFEPDRQTLILHVRLKPSTAYELVLTGTGFRSADGVPLAQHVWRFRTRGAAESGSCPPSFVPAPR